jgi:SHS2 domain-containing protein
VGSFAVVAGGPGRTARRHATAGSDEDLLVAVVDEVIYWLDAEGEVPVSVAVRRAGKGGVDLVLPLAAVSAMGIIGAAPKAASLHDLRCAPDPAGQWSRSVTIDVQDMARWL